MRQFLFLNVLIATLYAVQVNTTYGILEGYQVEARNGKLINVFKSVPFAAPPVGKLRWQKPQSPEPWKGVRDATKYSAACMSNSSTTSSPQKWVDEDCLYANIFVGTKCTKEQSCPVVVYMHGGDINYDSAVMFNDDVLINNFGAKDVVLVIPAFRLGFTGLMIFENDDVVPRNLPVYDIIKSLEYIQSEIKQFGGDPQRVTLLGHSMGGTLSIFLTFSKTINPDQKLFQRSVAMSPQIFFMPQEHLARLTAEFIFRAGCSDIPMLNASNERVSTSIECMRQKPGCELLALQRQMEDEGGDLKLFGGVLQLEPLFDSKNIMDFAVNPPKTDLVIGTTMNELDRNPVDMDIPSIFAYKNPQELYMKYQEDLRKGNLPFNHSMETQAFFLGTNLFAHNMAAVGATVFLYSFDYPRHAYHTDDLFYIMGIHPFEMDENEKIIKQIYPDYFLNFSKNGKPSHAWESLRRKDNNYMSVNVSLADNVMPHMKLHYQNEVLNYWGRNMVAYDAIVTLKKKANSVRGNAFTQLMPGPIIFNPPASRTDEFGQTPAFLSYSAVFFFVVLIFAMGFGLGRLTKPDEPPAYSEKQPLLHQMF